MKRMILPLLIAVFAVFSAFRLYASDASTDTQPAAAAGEQSQAIATFAGGCFWCVESSFEAVPGVSEVISGYSGGTEENPTYQTVSSGRTGHTEAVQVYYDPTVITYDGLLQVLWRTMDPTDTKGQFVDRGQQYRPAIYFMNEAQKQAAEQSVADLQKSGRYDRDVAIELTAFDSFHPAEDYHQNYYKTNPVRYKFYTFNSGRYQFIDKVWGDERKLDYAAYAPKNGVQPTATTSKPTTEQSMNQQSEAVPADAASTDQVVPVAERLESFIKPDKKTLKQTLTPMQYDVSQEEGTERPFSNEFDGEKREGIYVDIVSGEPLFSSRDKFDSGTGWPSFVRPLKSEAVVEKSDFSLFGKRTEIRSALADSHLGHVFEDGPKPTGLRYCMNSASMRFIPKDEMAEAGYAAYIDQIGPVGSVATR